MGFIEICEGAFSVMIALIRGMGRLLEEWNSRSS